MKTTIIFPAEIYLIYLLAHISVALTI